MTTDKWYGSKRKEFYVMREKFDDYKIRFEHLIKKGNFSRLGRNFETNSHKYFYDTGTGKVFQTEDNVSAVLSAWITTNEFESIFEIPIEENLLIEALDELFRTVEEQHILQAPSVQELYGPQVYDLDHALAKHRTQLMLELTEKCNMRCRYCIYHSGNGGYREFGKSDMSFQIAKLALDQFLKDSQEEELYVSFYGGEPLLRFPMIQQCIEYCLKNYSDKNIRFTMTTNATLMTREIAKYLAALPKAIITVSLDGPQEIHDKYRLFSNHTGSFTKTVQGLRYLAEEFGNRAEESLIINTVIAEYEEANLIKIQDFFDSLDWLPKNILHTSSYVDTPDDEVEYEGVDSTREKKLRQNMNNPELIYNPLVTWGVKKFMKDSSNKTNIEGIVQEGFIKELMSVHRRFLVDKPNGIYGMNGCCVPGARKIYVTVDGDYLVCEKMGPSPKIGNVFDGIDVQKIREFYVERFRKEAAKYCKNCWAINLCNICYTECFDENDINFKKRHKRCEAHRVSKERILATYHEILETSPKNLEFLDDYELA